MTLHKYTFLSRIVVAGALLALAGCGSSPRVLNSNSNSGNFTGAVAGESQPGNVTGPTAVASVSLSPANAMAGTSTKMTVNMTQPAAGDGAIVQLRSSDANVVAVPATVRIPAGQTSATVEVAASQVTDARTVAISALYGDTVAGTSLSVAPATVPSFTIALQPSTLTIVPGKSASAKITTKVATGYSNALQLKVSSVPTGVSVSFVPTSIPAPGAGTSVVHIKVASTVAPGIYPILVKATDGTTTRSVRLSLTVASSDAGATFQGCWYHSNGHRYQGVRFSVANPGTYPFDAVLYRGATCAPANFADEFGFGTSLNFGGFGYIFWFRDFSDQSDMSAFWHVGNDQSQCVNYAVAPDC